MDAWKASRLGATSLTSEFNEGLIAMSHFCQTQLARKVYEGCLRKRTDTVWVRDQPPLPVLAMEYVTLCNACAKEPKY